MKIDKDTHLKTLMDMADRIHDEMETWDDWSEDVLDAIEEYRNSFHVLKGVFAEDRRKRKNI